MSYDLDINKIKPLGSNVLVMFENDHDQDYVLGDIIVSETSPLLNSRYNKARVIAIGEGRVLDSGEFEKINISVGSVVLVDDLVGGEIIINGHAYHIINFSDVVAVILE